MALQLNPNTTDAYESKTLAQMRQMVYDGLGFIDPIDPSNTMTLGQMRAMITQALGLAVALLANTDSFSNILTDVYNACGWAAIGTHPPGVDTLIGTYINEAHRTLFARIEMDKGGVSPPSTLSGSTQTVIDATPVRSLAIALTKAKYGQADAKVYFDQTEKYLADLIQRTPPNITAIINACLVNSHNTVTRRWEMGFSGPDSFCTNMLASGVYGTDNTADTARGHDYTRTLVDSTPVVLRAMADLKKKIGQPDADDFNKQYEQYMADRVKRLPPNSRQIVDRTLKDAQQTLYRNYRVFRMQRWYTWTTVADQMFYGTFGDDNATSIAPTGLTAVAGSAVTSHNMRVGRVAATAVRLNSGKVFIAGGFGPTGGNLASTEIFDPATGVFTAGPTLATPRAYAVSVLLHNGKVLIIGGSAASILSSCEIYDPAANTITATGSLSQARFFHQAVTLLDGRVLVTGGGAPTAVATTEVYDAAAGTWSAGPSMLQKRTNHGMTLLNDGSVLVSGGAGQTLSADGNTAETIDASLAQFTATGGTMTRKREQHSSTLLTNGAVLIAGGSDNLGSSATNTAEVYDPVLRTFSAAANNMAAQRAGHSATLMANGHVLIAGSNALGAVGSTVGEFYDQQANTFTTSASAMQPGGSQGTAVALVDGRVLIAGGTTDDISVIVDTAQFYDSGADSFYGTGSLTKGSSFYVVTAATANGQSLPGNEAFALTVPANTGVNLSWTPTPKQPFVKWFYIYRGKASGAEGYIDRVPATQTTYIDNGTIPPGDAPPTINATAGPGALDPRSVTGVYLSQNNTNWRELKNGIPPLDFRDNASGVPYAYEIRQSLEVYPPPKDNTWQIRVEGYFAPFVFESDDDETTLDWQAIYLQAMADCYQKFPGRFDRVTIEKAEQKLNRYIGGLVAGSHHTARYVPGSAPVRNATPPVLVGGYQSL